MIKVLIADDEVDFLNSLSKVLTRRGITIVKASNGQEAVDFLSHEQVDVIVLDLRMPVMDGITALKHIRMNDNVTPIFILSGHSDLSYVTEALRGGAADYLLKPCPVETLVAAIETASEQKAIAQEIKSTQKK